MAQPGDVIVLNGGGCTSRALCGEIMFNYAHSKGIAGFVLDGVVVIRPEFAEEALAAVAGKLAGEMKTLSIYAAGDVPDRSKHIALYEKQVVTNGALVYDEVCKW